MMTIPEELIVISAAAGFKSAIPMDVELDLELAIQPP